MFYTYRQNNSGGVWVGPQYVIIEADRVEDIPESTFDAAGMYFNGCDSGRDCDCCGDRWSEYASEGTETPQIYGTEIQEGWEKDNLSFFARQYWELAIRIYFKDGSVGKFDYTIDEINKLKNTKTKSQPSVYGFAYYPMWNTPGAVFKAYQSDYSASTYYDLDGNKSLDLVTPTRLNKLSYRKGENDRFQAVYEKKEDAQKVRDGLVAILKDANDAARKVVESNKQSLPTEVFKVLMDRFKDGS